ncbi:hypothetical protein [Chromobacterium phragmitis]|uniref:DUF4279 domain-containing protein n=1 Tax=Chromobacterium phragmitis TaxID=2202141 RepID=A0ABV0INQ3_9NEIS
MITMECSCTLAGVDFNPDSFDNFSKEGDQIFKQFAGEVATRGRYKGTPIPEGCYRLLGSLERVVELLETIGNGSELNIDYVNVCLLVAHDGACNFELEPSLLTRLGRMNVTLGITCYEHGNLGE